MTVIAPAPRRQLIKIKNSVEYFDHQVAGVRELSKRSSFLLADEMGLGKLAPLTEPVLTPFGWRTMGDLRVGHAVIGFNGQPTQVLGVFPQGVLDIVRVTFNDGSSTRCGWEHLWNVQHVRNDGIHRYPGTTSGRWRTLTTRQIVDLGLSDGAGNHTWRIPMVQAVHFDGNAELPVDPYLLGALLGDGGLTTGSVTFTCAEPEILAEVEARVPAGIVVKKANDRYGYRLVRTGSGMNPLTGSLRALGVMGHGAASKFVPTAYLHASPNDRLEVLRGLLDTDGEARSDGHVSFSSASRMLADDVSFLVRSLGGTTRTRVKVSPKYVHNGEIRYGMDSHVVTVSLPPGVIPFRLSRKIERVSARLKYPPTRIITSVEPEGAEESVCIKVAAEDGLYVTNDFIVTHNSLTALTTAAVDFESGAASRVLIVAPVTLKQNWAQEIATHTNFTCLVLDGTPKQRVDQLTEYDEQCIDVLITNYEQIIAHHEALNALGFDIVIYDEAHYIKSRTSKRTKACQQLHARRHFLLTGSPLLNHVDDLWSLLYRIAPDEFPSYWKFLARFAVYGGYADKSIVGTKNTKELHALLAKHMLRREKKDALDLPEKLRVPIYVDLSPAQRKMYDQATDELRIELPDNPNPMELENALTKMLRLKQICGTTATIEGHPDSSTKLDVAVERIQELAERGERVVMFTQFLGVQAAMMQRLAALKVPVPAWEMNGATPQGERVGVVNAWAAGKPGALVAMLQVAGVGLNMTQASTVIFLDRLWSPKMNEQAEDRLHRIGQKNTVTIIDIICNNSVEQRIETILKRKSRLFNDVVQGGDDGGKWKRLLIESLMDEEALTT